jgi:putative oxidoreductase
MKAMQIAGGLLLLTNRFVSLAAIVLLPISVNIFLFHFFLAPQGMVVAILVLIANLMLLLAYRKNYQALLAR